MSKTNIGDEGKKRYLDFYKHTVCGPVLDERRNICFRHAFDGRQQDDFGSFLNFNYLAAREGK